MTFNKHEWRNNTFSILQEMSRYHENDTPEFGSSLGSH